MVIYQKYKLGFSYFTNPNFHQHHQVLLKLNINEEKNFF